MSSTKGRGVTYAVRSANILCSIADREIDHSKSFKLCSWEVPVLQITHMMIADRLNEEMPFHCMQIVYFLVDMTNGLCTKTINSLLEEGHSDRHLSF